jgi:hypothetical protein
MIWGIVQILPLDFYLGIRIKRLTGQTYGDKVVSQEGNSPKQEYKVPKLLFSVKKEVYLN